MGAGTEMGVLDYRCGDCAGFGAEVWKKGAAVKAPFFCAMGRANGACGLSASLFCVGGIGVGVEGSFADLFRKCA